MSAEKDEQTFENIKQLELVSQIKPLSNPKFFWLLRRRVHESRVEARRRASRRGVSI